MLTGHAQRGVTLLELMVTVVIVAILLAVAMPYFGGLIARGAVASGAQLIQNALRQAEAEAIRRNSDVEFLLTDDVPSVSSVASLVAKANGKNWTIRVVDAAASNRYVNGYTTKDISGGIAYQGPASIRFSGAGRVLDSTGVAVSGKQIFRVSQTGVNVAYCVFVTPGGGVKTCNPALASGNPQACQPILAATDCPGG
ncbi:MAG: prepilin-type N-terminal cleavage/methylation domain-containing protein [Rhodocyclaceae bacterium]|nr:MAG: prepilin-type N-terminal cleavage/methylation domain-containing protein [Rhodocyclaceae bacterium]